MRIIKGSNFTFSNMYDTLNKINSITGRLGYAISKTKRKIAEELIPFNEQKELLLKKYGEQDKETGQLSITSTSQHIEQFMKQFQPVAEIILEIPFMQVTEEEFENNESLFTNKEITVQVFDLLQELFIEKEEKKEGDKE